MTRICGRAIIIENDEVLLMFRRRLENNILKEYYAIPGGKQEIGETVEECVIRELKEEFSIDIEVLNYLGTVEDDRNIGYVYHCKKLKGNLKLGGEELEECNPDNYYEIRCVKLSEIDNIELLPENKFLIKKAIEELKVV